MSSQDANVALSKNLSWLLRHNAEKEGIEMDPSSGFVHLSAVLAHPRFRKLTEEDVKKVVENCHKQRFSLREVDGTLKIRANQGHSIKLGDNMASSHRGGHHHRPHHSRGPPDPRVALSKGLSWLLRHNAEKEGLDVDNSGFVHLSAVLAHPKFSKFGVEDVKKVVEECDKKRFTLKEFDGTLKIRANQGHSIKVDDDLLLEPLKSDTVPNAVIHGTYSSAWTKIKEQGLCRMTRNHIHFAAGEPGTEGVISGLRASAEIYIYVDVRTAMEDGIKFYKSSNNVILSPGNSQGFLLPKYFAKVINIRSRKSLI